MARQSPEQTARARKLRQEATLAERRLWAAFRAIRRKGLRIRRQHPVAERYILDFVCLPAGLALELDGPQHALTEEYDQRRDAFLASLGIEVIRVTNADTDYQAGVLAEWFVGECEKRLASG